MTKLRYAAITATLLLVVGIVSSASAASSDFTISASPSSLNISAGDFKFSTITLASKSFTGNVALSASVSPASSTISTTFSPSTVSLTSGGTGSSTLQISTTPFTPLGTYTVTVTGTSGSLSHSAQISVTVTSATVGAASQFGTSAASTLPSIEFAILAMGTIAVLGLYLKRLRTPSFPGF